MIVRTRMAPSPTGEYHIGGMRTMLFNYALAKKYGGEFILRIEDTDQKRLIPGAIDRILKVIKAYGLSWDEGPEVGGPYGPYIQSERLDIYKQYAMELLQKGTFYRCFCSQERLNNIREEQLKNGVKATKYDRYCLNLDKKEIDEKVKNGEPFVLRLKVPDSQDISWEDLFLGKITINSSELDDQVMLKSDGFPTYHLAVVVDDHLMKISHIMRGMEWLPSTPKHIILYRAFEWEVPLHGHLPNLKEIGSTKKLSKRVGDVTADDFLKDGYLPQALLNFLMFLGWNPGTEKEIYTLDEFILDFSLERAHKTDLVVFDREKLLWLNGYYIRNSETPELLDMILKWTKKYSQADLSMVDDDRIKAYKILDLVKDRMKVLSDFPKLIEYFYQKPDLSVIDINQYSQSIDKTLDILKSFKELFENVNDSDWIAYNLDTISHELLTKQAYKPKEAFMTLRLVLTGQAATPPLFDVMEVLGKVEVLERINKSIS